jgi:hypothetical protein
VEYSLIIDAKDGKLLLLKDDSNQINAWAAEGSCRPFSHHTLELHPERSSTHCARKKGMKKWCFPIGVIEE